MDRPHWHNTKHGVWEWGCYVVLKSGGAYEVRAEMADGNRKHIDTAETLQGAFVLAEAYEAKKEKRA